jgi:hypothetical protein
MLKIQKALRIHRVKYVSIFLLLKAQGSGTLVIALRSRPLRWTESKLREAVVIYF